MSRYEWIAWFSAWFWLFWDICRLQDRIDEVERAVGLPPRKRFIRYGREDPRDASLVPWAGVVDYDDNEQWFTVTWAGLFVAVYIGACKQPD